MKKLALALMLTCLTSAAAFTVGRRTATRLEDCIQYDPSLLRIEDMGERGWHLTAGRIWLHIFDSREDAEAGLAFAQQHNYQCFIGRDSKRPDRIRYILEYWK